MPEKERGRKLYIEESPPSQKTTSLFPSYQSESLEKRIEGTSVILQHASHGPRMFYDTDEPHHIPTLNDVSRKLCAFSQSEEDWTEIDVIFVDDLDENWISERVVERLGLEIENSDVDEYCHLDFEARTLPFLGCVELQWGEKDGQNNISSHFDDCRVVPDESFEVFLKISLLPGSVLKFPPVEDYFSSEPVQVFSPIAPADNTFISAQILTESSSAGSFDGAADDCKEDSAEAMSADLWMTYLQRNVHNRIFKEEDYYRSRLPVKIAVLDTGVDTTHIFIKAAMKSGRIQSLKNFVKDDATCEDSFGHGTHVAALLLKVAPDAQLHVLKVAKDGKIPAGHSIAEAIRWATGDLGADIITMSFGLEGENIEVQKAILEAFCKKILIFAAASNDGGNKRVTYPARKDEVICIYATDGLGTPFKGNPTTMSSGYNFATLGVGVKSAWPRECQDEPKPKKTERSERRMTGTSFATPIVAGIAACIVEFAYMHDFPETLLEKLRSRQGMQEILRKHMVEEQPRSDLHYIHPWELFKDRTDKEVIVLISDVLKRS